MEMSNKALHAIAAGAPTHEYERYLYFDEIDNFHMDNLIVAPVWGFCDSWYLWFIRNRCK